ncbi:NAD(P)-dependent oxidoreductase [Oceanimonas baumannii]|uniref:2-hydroxy-3-oxopropionate reductase n=1 Tax=Oceanimonas baumannii TaxID=129578 RepID=A0A235CHZ1_9GAMM|nr:NAD(P)-dependent oxidoreductase [Oceanimonas baumannii]OYD24228.1 2-hydroxy-3-oxopropionate reductase [Oceanimonas baumannii]TDW58954.1 3-hydroxyisobutyrate dehydrogenase [Oceanimonas baumannii]
MKLGFIGIGLMGKPMTERLLAAGFDVTVWNRSTDKLAEVVTAGAQVAGSIGELTEQVDLVLLCLANTAVVENVVFGEGGVASHGRAGQLLVDFSSSDPDATRDYAKRLNSACGMGWIDSPVSGGVAGAEDGTLAIMCGGEEADIERIRPVLAPLSQRVTRMGGVGAGQVTKVCNQMIVGCNLMVLAEMMALAKSCGVDAEQIPAALAGGFADSRPMQITGPLMAEESDPDPKWHVRTLLKDLDMAVAQSLRAGSATPMSGLAAQLMRQHGSKGFLERDPATLIKLYKDA